MAYDSERGVTVLFGGYDVYSGPVFGDTWEWDGTTWTQQSNTGPSKRYDHAMAYDVARGVTVLFGGDSGHSLGETWEWDGDRRAWWTNYGAGWPGTNGIPSFTAAGDPVLCSTITLDLANSLGTSSIAALFIGVAPGDLPTSYDGHLLVSPKSILVFSLPGAGLALPAPLPCDGSLCGRSVYLEALEVDAGASEGVSFTRGLRLVLGSP
jgi:hypothetical protein